MRIDSSGNVGIGTASPTQRLEISQPTGTALRITNSSASGTANNAAYAILNCPQNSLSQFYRTILATSDNGSTYDWGIGNFGTSAKDVLAFYTGGLTERMRIDSSGNVGIGGTADATDKVTVAGNLPVSSTISISFANRGVITSATTGASRGFQSYPSTAAASFALNDLTHFWAGQNTLGAGSSVTNQYGFYVHNSVTGATNNYGFHSNIASGSNRWNFYAAGTAQNYFAGNTGIANTPSPDYTLAVGQSANNKTTLGLFSTGSGDVGQRALVISKYDNNSTTSQVFVQFAINNNGIASGQINANGANAAAFGTWSDARLKENIVDLPPQLANICALRPVEFDYKAGGHQIGFIAQEMQEVYADSVGENKDGMLTITGWSKTEARLVKAIQELAARVAELEAK
jgi:hypothetical protein